MKYRQLEGFDAIRAMEADDCLKEINESLAADSAVTFSLAGTVNAQVPAAMDMTVQALIDAAGGLKSGGDVKFVHLGSPLGVIVAPADFGKSLGELLSAPAVSAGGCEAVVCGSDICAVEYMRGVLAQLRDESCGRCVLCRMALAQLAAIFDDAVNGRGRAEDISTMGDITEAMELGAFCRFGKAAGALADSFCKAMAAEFEAHARRKTCDAGVCKKYLSYHILGSKCTACGDCMDVCDEDAITGKRGFIHMIDEFDCTRCGKCLDACEEGAIVLAGAIKPKTPEKLTRVGAWKGK